MNIVRHLIVAGCLALSLGACKQEAAKVDNSLPPLAAAPATENKADWQPWLKSVAEHNMDGVNNMPFAYFLPAESSADYKGEYDRLLERVQMDLSRGIVEGNMLIFASPGSTKMADLMVTAFADVKPNTMKNVKVLFAGDPADKDRVAAAVNPAGVKYVFVPTK